MAKVWQRYERVTTGEIVLFKQLRPGMYESEKGLQLNVVSLNKYFQWIGPSKVPRRKEEYVTTINGFKVRVKNENSKSTLQSGGLS